MNSSYKYTKLVFAIIILLPTVIFSIYEIGTFRQNEKVIESIYGNQLDAILYSVNQYSDDIISSWANDIEEASNNISSKSSKELSSFITEVHALEGLYQFDTNYTLKFSTGLNLLNKELDSLVTENQKSLNRLNEYLKGGYRKIEPLNLSNKKIQLLAFAIEKDDKHLLNIIAISPTQFIREVLDPKIQEITQDKFYIGAYFESESNIIYNSDKQYRPKKYEYKKPFWFLNNYFLGIELKDQTINKLVKSRSRKNLILIAIIDLVLLFGAWLINRNIRKQMELARIKSDFISNVSHEIRTPLALISMYIETLDLGRIKSEEKKKNYYSVISQETKRLSNMVNNILNFSKIENNNRSYHLNKVDLNSIVQDVIGTFKFHLDKQNYNLNIEFDTNLPDIQADKDAVTEAIVNLIDNSIKYGNSNKTIGIKTGIENNFAYVEVTDKGIGITESDQKHIFEKFYRVTEKNLAHKAKGSGLGLAIVKHVMDAHSGHIIVKSKLGEGSSFKLLFPNNSNQV